MRAFIAAAWLFAAVINGAMWYRPAPSVAAPVKVASWLDKHKVQDRILAAVTATPERSLPWSCETIRNAVASLTKEQVEHLSRIYRLNAEQRADARRCLKEKRT